MMNRDSRASLIRRAGVASGLAALAAAALLVGCSKPPPPKPPPAPPPPPPPPANIKLEDLGQELRADARVQFAPEMEVSESDAEYGRAIVRLADALAKGDSKAVRGMLTRDAQSILDQLETEGGWDLATKNIEAVRVVYVGGVPSIAAAAEISDDAPTAAAAAAPAIDPAEIMATIGPKAMEFGQAVMQAISALPPDKQQALSAKLQAAGANASGFDPNNLTPESHEKAKAGFAEQMKAYEEAGVPADQIAKLKTMFDELWAASLAAVNPAPAEPADDGAPKGVVVSGQGFLMAVQDPSGSYLLGWQGAESGGSWLFTHAPANSGARPRASAWDGVGEAGFLEGPVGAGGDDAPAADASVPGTDPAPSATDAPTDSAPSPNRKNTPAGPVTIPGG